MRQLTWAVGLTLLATLMLPATADPKEQLPPDATISGGATTSALNERKGVVSWKTLSRVEEVRADNRVVPKFSAEIANLNNKEVKLQGFMMPLEAGKKQKHFLLSANVPSCPFCMPGGPDSLIEVTCKEPIAFSMDPIVISGKLTVLSDDPSGLWYRASNAVLVPDGKL